MGLFNNNKAQSFYDLLNDQAKLTVDGVQALCDYCGDPTPENAQKVMDLEKSADKARRLLISEINKTFITPIDREDLFELSCAVDDIVDYAATTIEELQIYKVGPDAHITKISSVLLQLATGIYNSVSHLEKNKDIAADEAVKVKKLENTTNDLYHTAMSELYETDDIKSILKYREIYRHLNHASDKGDNAADIILTIIVKM